MLMLRTRVSFLLLLILLYPLLGSSQHQSSQNQPADRLVHLDVVVSAKSGAPVGGLHQQDFTLLDNKAVRPISSFKAVTGRDAPMEVVVVIDAVNTSTQSLGYERTQIDAFLREEGGHLAYPVALVVFTDRGSQILGEFSRDGNTLSTSLDKDDLGLRYINRSSGYYGAAERLQLSLTALRQLVASAAPRPGRKIILWVSPGWPLLSGPNTELSSKDQQQIFTDIVNLSTQLRQTRVTLYSVDPIGAAESIERATNYQEYLKGVTKPGQVNLGNLALQVLALQSGGLAFSSTNDVAKLMQECVTGSVPYYEISFDSPPASQPDEYHRLEIKVAEPRMVARTRQGYYAQP